MGVTHSPDYDDALLDRECLMAGCGPQTGKV
jgi:hypothetical protein